MKQRIIGIGETVLDILFKNDQPQAAVPGGSTFNSMISLGRVGIDCAIITEMGDDHVGDITCQYMRSNGVSDRYAVRHKGIKSHVSLAFLDDHNDAHYQFYKDHAKVSLGALHPEFTASDCVLFGSFFAINPAIRPEVKSLLTAAHEAGALLYYDVNFRKPHLADLPVVGASIEENMRLATIVRGSADDFAILYGMTDAEEIYNEKIAPLCPWFISTNGGQQISVFGPNFRKDYTVEAIATVSTVGAGDNFNAGFLYALQRIGKRDLASLTTADWDCLIASGQRFAQDVCQQMGNSISPQLAEQLKHPTLL